MKILKYAVIVSAMALFGACAESNSISGTQPEPAPPAPPAQTYTDTELLDMVQRDAIKYFWDYAHPVSKLARERYHTDNPGFEQDIVTSGGSGFGLMSIIVGIERGFIPRAEAVGRLNTALDFLTKAEKFHGAFPHWIDGNTGKAYPFSVIDNGADLVETSFLVQGLITLREYFKNGTAEEQALAKKADDIWRGVDWNWFTRGQDSLYWHWSPDYEWQLNMNLDGYNETHITHILAASSPTYGVSSTVYHRTWAENGAIKSDAVQYGIKVLANYNGAPNNVGPLFWAHYSYLGLDPRGLSDAYLNYGDVVTNHAKIVYQYTLANPKKFAGYSEKNWGLTASYSRNPDGSTGYDAHSVVNDKGVISPTAALSSFPYTPNESMRYLRYLYNDKKDKYIGLMGPYDAYSEQYNWVTPRYLAIDQGTIAPMIENYRTGLLWKLFMNAPEIRTGLKKLGITSTQYGY